MKLATLLILLAASSSEAATTDFKCMNDCSQRGYMYTYCHQQCTVQDQQPYQWQPLQPVAPPTNQPQQKQIDYQCMNNCTNAGYQYGFCQSKCSY